MLVRFWMTKDPAVVGPRTRADEALRLMQERQFRRMPVVDGGRLVGIVTDANLTSALQYYAGRFDKACQKRDFSKILVRNVMAPSPFTVQSDSSVAEVARLLYERKIGGLPVVDKGKVVGIITESDIYRALLNMLGFGLPGMPVTFLLSHEPNDLHDVMGLVKTRGLRIHGLATVGDYSPTQCLVMVHVEGKGVEDFLEDLRARRIPLVSVRGT